MSKFVVRPVTTAQNARLESVLVARRVMLEAMVATAVKRWVDVNRVPEIHEKAEVEALEEIFSGIFGNFFVVVPPEGMSAKEFETRLQFLAAEWDYERE